MPQDPEGRHIRLTAAIAGVMIGLGPVVALLNDFHDVKTPTFVGLSMAVIGGVIGAIYVPRKMMDRVDSAVDRAMTRRAAEIVKAERGGTTGWKEIDDDHDSSRMDDA